MARTGFTVRNQRVVRDIDLHKETGLELGPLTAPVVRKDQGKIFYLDHMSLKDLQEKYKNEPVELDKIVAPDFVLGNSLKESVRGKRFDYVIASHVIEHIPDTVTWLNDIASILKPGGSIRLVIPDKRFTFDLLRQDTSPSQVIESFFEKIEKPSISMMYDYASNYALSIDTASVWNDWDYYDKLPPKLRWNKREAMAMALSKEYIDCHCHVYTPESFIKIIKELTKQKLIGFEIDYFIETQPYELEFFVALKKTQINDSNLGALIKKIPKIKNYNQDKAQAEILKKENKKLTEDIQNITSSSSWRVTQPLRSINKTRKQLRANTKHRN
jgi:ubiquinone/menaquinone biosynthesis C-methylase UbiE